MWGPSKSPRWGRLANTQNLNDEIGSLVWICVYDDVLHLSYLG